MEKGTENEPDALDVVHTNAERTRGRLTRPSLTRLNLQPSLLQFHADERP